MLTVPAPIGLPTLEEILDIRNGYFDREPPPEIRKLMGVGPVPISRRVALAHGLIIDHLGSEIGQVIENIRALGRWVVQDSTATVIGVSGPGSAAMEMCIANLVRPGDKVLACITGVFSERMAIMAKRIGAQVVEYRTRLGDPVRAVEVKRLLAQNGQFRVVMLVHGETSTGVENTEFREVFREAKEAGCLTILDTVCTLGALPMMMREWRADAVFTGGQKSIGAVPGMSLAFFNQDAMRAISDRTDAPVQWCYDVRLANNFWGPTHGYHYTAPTPSMLALHEALVEAVEEGLEQRWNRHWASSHALQTAMEAMGLQLFTDERWRLGSAVAVRHPDGMTSPDEVKSWLRVNRGTVIAGAFGGLPIWRIGQMGLQATPEYTMPLLDAFDAALEAHGFRTQTHGSDTYREVYDRRMRPTAVSEVEELASPGPEGSRN